jgi:hypothetical protein
VGSQRSDCEIGAQTVNDSPITPEQAEEYRLYVRSIRDFLLGIPDHLDLNGSCPSKREKREFIKALQAADIKLFEIQQRMQFIAQEFDVKTPK